MDAFVPRAQSGRVLGLGVALGVEPVEALADGEALGVALIEGSGVATTAPAPVLAFSITSGSSASSLANSTLAWS